MTSSAHPSTASTVSKVHRFSASSAIKRLTVVVRSGDVGTGCVTPSKQRRKQRSGGAEARQQSVDVFIARFFEPLKHGDLVQQTTRLLVREMLEPTGLWTEQMGQKIKPADAALVDVLACHLCANQFKQFGQFKQAHSSGQADDDLHRLDFSIQFNARPNYFKNQKLKTSQLEMSKKTAMHEKN